MKANHQVSRSRSGRAHLRAVAVIALIAAGGACAQVSVNLLGVENRSAGGSRTHCEGVRCYVAQGHTLVAKLNANGIAGATHVVDGSNSIDSSLTGWKESPNFVEVQVKPSANASRGTYTLRVQQRAPTGHVLAEWPFTVDVINNGQFQPPVLPSFTNFVTEAEIVINGSKLDNAKIFIPNDAPTPKPTLTRLSTSTASQLRIRATWAEPQSNPKLRFTLCDAAYSGFGCVAAWGTVQGTVQTPPAVKSITCAPNPAKPGDDMEITFALTGPARPGGDVLSWKISSAGDFAAISGSCPYNNQGTNNTVTVTGGNDLQKCKVKVVQASGAGAGSVSRTIDTWMVNADKSTAPWHKSATCKIKAM